MTYRAPSSTPTCSGTPTGAQLSYDNEGRCASWQDKPASPTTTASEGPALVERVAALPPLPTQQTQWRHFNFASKLAHFFMNAELFPIYDSYVVQMVKYHLGHGRYQHDDAHPYQAFIANLQRLREYADLSCTGRDLDRYLWLSGEYRNWHTNVGKVNINAELRQLFTALSASVEANLDALLPSLQGIHSEKSDIR